MGPVFPAMVAAMTSSTSAKPFRSSNREPTAPGSRRSLTEWRTSLMERSVFPRNFLIFFWVWNHGFSFATVVAVLVLVVGGAVEVAMLEEERI